jgi:hypothetical protein
MKIFGSISGFIVLLSTFAPLSAQWLHYPTPGIPRTPDGKPNLSAPTPKTREGKPDLSGIWRGPKTNFSETSPMGLRFPCCPERQRSISSARTTWRKAIHPSVVSGTA